jgi:hypothetical protein
MSVAARDYAAGISWREIAAQTMTAMRATAADARTAGVPGDPVAAR